MSEMEARVFNFLSEISEHIVEETRMLYAPEMKDDELCSILSKYSDMFADYYKLYQIFSSYIGNVPVVTKQEFAKKYL